MIKNEVRKSFLPCSVAENREREVLIKSIELLKFFLPVDYFAQFVSREPFNISEDEFTGRTVNKKILVEAFGKHSLGRIGNYDPEKKINTNIDFGKSRSMGNLVHSTEPQRNTAKETYHPSSKKAKVENNSSVTSFFGVKK